MAAKAWPFVEARKLLARVETGDGAPIVLQTGYGPSGLPHIGTFAEVARTSMVRRAFAELSDHPVRLICFSDDMDGLRKVPDNVANREELAASLNLPLTRVPDPFGTHDSFGAHNNARLCAFLDQFGFEYEFVSATECYRSGRFDDMLLRVLERYDAVQEIMLPTLGPERRRTYSPFLPISPATGRVLQVPVLERNPAKGTILFEDEDGERVELSVTGGNVKLQWKPDWAMRWVALGIDYEMSGKDLIDSVRDSSAIARVLGGSPPEGFSFEHFLDVDGTKISKSKGNGIAIETWLAYAPQESLAHFMYANPTRARRLHLDAIPATMDDYQRDLAAYHDLDGAEKLETALWHVHAGEVPSPVPGPGYRTLVNLAAVTSAGSAGELWSHLRLRQPDLPPEAPPERARLIGGAVRFSRDVLAPRRKWRQPDEREIIGLRALRDAIVAAPADSDAETYQNLVYGCGKEMGGPLRDWFRLLYQSLLGQDHGPRFGGFIVAYGVAETVALIDRAIAGELAEETESTT